MPFNAPQGEAPLEVTGSYTDGSTQDLATLTVGMPLVCSADHWCWQNPLPQGNQLNGIWGSDADNVWAVGQNGTIV